MTKKQKLEEYDALSAKAGKLELALHDLANDRFSVPVKLPSATIKRDYDPTWDGGSYEFRISWRAMPLVLSVYSGKYPPKEGRCDQIEIWTEQEIQEKFRANPTSVYWRMLMAARYTLIAKYNPDAATA